MKPSASVETTYRQLVDAFSSSTDLAMKTMRFAECEYRLFYLDTMIDTAVFQDHVVKPLTQRPGEGIQETLTLREIKATEDFEAAVHGIVHGKTVLQKDGESTLYVLGTELKKERQVNIPSNERVLRGAKEAFIENLDTNVNMLRKQMATQDLVVNLFTLGRVTHTRVAIVYMKGLANDKVIGAIDQRLRTVDSDYIDAPGFIQELIQDKPIRIFPQLLTTERTDRARAYLLEGKVAIMAEGSPEATLLPVSLWAFLQSPDDYQINWVVGSAFRLLRVTCFFLTLVLPALYISLATFQSYVLPMNLALTLQGSLKYITFQPVLEVIIVLLALEIFREATVRLPSPISQAIGVVGGIVVGTALVQSNLLSNTAVIVASATGLASFIIPSFEMSNCLRILNYPIILLSSLLGLVGLVFAMLWITIYLCRMNTLGLPYFYPAFADGRIRDTLFRAPFRHLKERPMEASPMDRQRLRNPKG